MTNDPLDPTDNIARTIWGEARGQGQAGMEAVASVIANRVRNPRWWGRDWVSVCRKPYQFSCWNPGDPNLPKLTAVNDTDPQFVMAQSIAAAVIAGALSDPTSNADSYYDLSIPAPSWAASAAFTTEIAGMRFYRLELPAPTTHTPSPSEGMASEPTTQDPTP